MPRTAGSGSAGGPAAAGRRPRAPRPSRRRQVRHEVGQLGHRAGGVGLLAALVELVDGQPPDGRVLAQLGDRLLPLGVRCPQLVHASMEACRDRGVG